MPANSDDHLPMSPLRARFQPLLWLGVTFLSVSLLTRLALLLVTGDGIPASPSLWLYAFGVGLGYDLMTLLYFALPLVLLLWLLPTRWLLSGPGRLALGALCLLLLCVMLFVALAEWTFWEEFQTRFNFIAVDYLVYTREVIGNIRESYAVGWLLTALGVVAGLIFIATRRWHRAQDTGTTFAGRSAITAGWLLLTALGSWLVDAELKDRTDNQYANELAGNGIYQFFAAYRSASLDYDRFYRALPLDQAFALVRRQLASADARFVSRRADDITREIRNAAPERRLNVVLISVESLSAEFSGTYGRVESLTPQLDALSRDSLLFTRLFATGTRTVRGLEALSLSVPPTPGESIVKRPHNEGLASLAEVFNKKGYVSQFLYGGYGAFDNMKYFFANNGYEVHDRAQVDKKTIQHGNIWGVSDEDLYTMALGEFDRTHAAGKPFFGHVLTTSNHRPYTFPEGRGPWPQGKRIGAVAYSDWAIGDFLRRARGKPWFADTVFVITADHCAFSAGKASLPAFRYHIPLWIYSPGNIAPGRWDRLTSQIDLPPTLLGLLGMDYRSQFYGVDVMQQAAGRERAFIGTYQLLGYLRNDQLIQLAPHRRVDAVLPAYQDDRPQPQLPVDNVLASEAISYYQSASYRFAHGLMRDDVNAPPRQSAIAKAANASR